MLNLNIKISKFSNLYSFVSDLSQWGDYKYYGHRRKEWIKKTGRISQKENKLLLDFKNIHEKLDEHIEIFFIFNNKKEIKKELKSILSIEDIDYIFYILKCFEKRFNIIWDIVEKKLLWIKKQIGTESVVIKNIILDIFTLCGLDTKEPFKINILLLISGFSDLHGWVSDNNIAFECSGWKKNKIKELVYSVLPHEIFHILLKQNGLIKKEIEMISKKYEDGLNFFNKNFGLSNKMFLEELVLSSFIPEGYLSEKYLNNISKKYKNTTDSNDKLLLYRLFVAKEMRAVAGEYVNNGLHIDKEYINKIKNTILTYKL